MLPEPPTIIYTLTDEAPALATSAFLPVVQAFANAAGIKIETADISLASRVLSEFPDYLAEEDIIQNTLAALGRWTQNPNANIIKLPNISASVPQLIDCIKELQAKGYPLPDYPETTNSEAERALKARYAKCLGSAVNPVLREGNSDRRAPLAVKNYAKKNPHSMSEWKPWSTTHVSHMNHGDFYHSEKSVTLDTARDVRMELTIRSGQTIVLNPKIALQVGEIIDSMCMSKKALCEFYEGEMEDCREAGILFSLHLKATMMQVSDPIIFGHCVRIYYKEALQKHGKLLEQLGVNLNHGIANLYDKITTLPSSKREAIIRDLRACQEHRPELAMVNPTKGITNLHSPSDVIIDASIPAMIRAGGKMFGADGKPYDTKAVMPDSTFTRIYQEMINFCKWHGQLDPKTMGTVPNVGLMAQKAEEYGSHDKTYEIQQDGIANIVDLATGEVLLSQNVEQGDIWRMCQVKDTSIRDWIKLAVTRARKSNMPAVFWLDPYRPHEYELIKKVRTYLEAYDTKDLKIQVMSQVRAMRYTLERAARGLDTISVTGNILRDYLTDLFPIMELGTSAKMLSIVPLMAGGCMYETGAGGSAPKHVQQLLETNHLRWDSLGEFMALAASLEELGDRTCNVRAKVLSKTLDIAIEKLLYEKKAPSRSTEGLDNRGSQFYLSMYWAQALALQSDDQELQVRFIPFAQSLVANEQKILNELQSVQGTVADIGGYYYPDAEKCRAVMRPSASFNAALAALNF